MLTAHQQAIYQLTLDRPQALLLESDASGGVMFLKDLDDKLVKVRGRTVAALVRAGYFERVSGYTERVTRQGRTRLFSSTWYRARDWARE